MKFDRITKACLVQNFPSQSTKAWVLILTTHYLSQNLSSVGLSAGRLAHDLFMWLKLPQHSSWAQRMTIHPKSEHSEKQEAEASGSLTDQVWSRPCIILPHSTGKAATGQPRFLGEEEQNIYLSKASDKESAVIFNLPHKVEQVEVQADSFRSCKVQKQRECGIGPYQATACC